MGSKGSNTTTQNTTTAPNPQAMQSYSNLLTQAQGVASTPYSPYTGELVAPVNQQQNLGIAGINQYANAAQPNLGVASGMVQGASQPLTQAQIQSYMSPYTQDVVNATQNQFNNTNQQQQQQVTGNAIAQGALGGNRTGVAAAELANQQNLAQAPVIAGLENQGYQTGLSTAAQQYQQNPMAAAGELGNLGVAQQTAGLSGAGAQLGAGGVQQSTQQALDAALLQQYQTQQAYPYQQAQWLAGIDTGVGSQMGGTSSGTTTAPAPNIFGQIAGGLTSGVGLLGATGAYGSTGWLAPALASIHRGGRVNGYNRGGVAGFATGGSPGGVAGMPWSTAPTWGWIPTNNISHGSGTPQAHAPAAYNPPQNDLTKQAASLGGLAKTIQDSSNGIAPLQTGQTIPNAVGPTSVNGAPLNGGSPYGGASYQNSTGGFNGMSDAAQDALQDSGGMHRGGVAGYADGGDPSFDDRFNAVYGDNGPPINPTDPFRMPSVNSDGSPLVPDNTAPDYSDPDTTTPVMTAARGVAPGKALAFSGNSTDVNTNLPPEVALGYSDDTNKASGIAPSDVRAKNEPQGIDWSGNSKLWPSLMSAGFGMMASRSPFLGNAIGEGGEAGLATYSAEKQQEFAQDKANQQLALEKEKVERPYTEMTADQKAVLRQQELQLQRTLSQPVDLGTDMMGRQVKGIRDPAHLGQFLVIDPQTGQLKPWNQGQSNLTPGTQQSGVVNKIPDVKPDSPIIKAAYNDPSIPEYMKPQEAPYDKDMLAQMAQEDPRFAATVKGVIDYNINPATIPMKQRSVVMGSVAQVSNNTYDQTLYPAKQRAVTEFFAGGPSSPAGTLTAGNTAVLHAGEMYNMVDSLASAAPSGLISKTMGAVGSAGVPFLSAAAKDLQNRGEVGTGSPMAIALSKWDDIKTRFTDEVTKFYAGSHGSEAERDRAIQLLSQAKTPEELKAAIRQDITLMRDKVDQLQGRLIAGMHPAAWKAAVNQDPSLVLLYKNSRETTDKILKGGQQQPTQAGTQAQPTQPVAKPSLNDFLSAAKAHNPGVSDQALTDYYNKKYGGQ